MKDGGTHLVLKGFCRRLRPDATDQTLLTFRSTRILRTGNGKLEVVGDLTLSRVEGRHSVSN